MKLVEVKIKNYRSVTDGALFLHDHTTLVGANNSGKSTIINAIRLFFDEIKWSKGDYPKSLNSEPDECWIQITLTALDNAKVGDQQLVAGQSISLRRFFGTRRDSKKSNCFVLNSNGDPGVELDGGKMLAKLKLVTILYIPASSDPNSHIKLSGPSALRDTIQYLMEKAASTSPAYAQLQNAVRNFETESKAEEGFLTKLSGQLNEKLLDWKTTIDLCLGEISVEELTKSLIQLSVLDGHLDSKEVSIDLFGQGFQRTLVYELISAASKIKESSHPNPTLILFEEPEAYLHPGQQELLAHSLRKLSDQASTQVIITTHSPLFIDKSTDNLIKLVRLKRVDGSTNIYQPDKIGIENLVKSGGRLLSALQAYVASPGATKRDEANRMIRSASTDPAILEAEEAFRHQLWLDGDRSSVFFAERVLLVEGATERVLLNRLLWSEWDDLLEHKIFVTEAMGKYNFHRFMVLLEVFGISHGVVLDDDHDKDHHKAINELVENTVNPCTLAKPVKLLGCLEEFLGLTIPGRDDKKPIEILRLLAAGAIDKAKIDQLKAAVKQSLAL